MLSPWSHNIKENKIQVLLNLASVDKQLGVGKVK
jgi:hypothetical protein